MLPRFAAAWEPDLVDVALAKALTDASAAGRFDIVAQLLKALESRRLTRLSGVASMAVGSASTETHETCCSRERSR